MAAELIDGKKLAAETRAQIAAGVAALKAGKGVTPGLAVILVGDNPASVSYVTAKEKGCVEALNLDGGLTATMMFNGKAIETGGSNLRSQGSMICFGTIPE